MNRGRVRFHSWRITALPGHTRGYTIVETLIFLAVSAAMFVAVVLLVNGQQQRTEFTQAVRNFESSLQDIANDVSTGYAAYPFKSGDTCKVTGTNSVAIDDSEVGTQQRCIFLGRVVQARPNGTNNQTYQTYTVVGRQRTTAGKEVQSLAEATPVALAPGTNASNASVPNYSETDSISASARIAKVTYRQGAVDTPISAFGLFTTFQSYSATSIKSGDLQVDLAPIAGSTLGDTSAALVNRIDSHSTSTPTITPLNPDGGITVCLLSNGSNQYALVRIGGGGTGRLAVTTSIETGSPPPGKCS